MRRTRRGRCERCNRKGLGEGYEVTRVAEKTRQRTVHGVLRTEYAWRCDDCGHIIWSVYEW